MARIQTVALNAKKKKENKDRKEVLSILDKFSDKKIKMQMWKAIPGSKIRVGKLNKNIVFECWKKKWWKHSSKEKIDHGESDHTPYWRSMGSNSKPLRRTKLVDLDEVEEVRAKHKQQEKLASKTKRKPAVKNTESSGDLKETIKKLKEPEVNISVNKKKNLSRLWLLRQSRTAMLKRLNCQQWN